LWGDQHDRAAAVGDAAAYRHQLANLVRQQHGGRLVENQQPRCADQALDDLDPLSLAHRQIAD